MNILLGTVEAFVLAAVLGCIQLLARGLFTL